MSSYPIRTSHGSERKHDEVVDAFEDESSLPAYEVSPPEGKLWRQAAAEIDWKRPPGLEIDTSNTLELLDGLRDEASQRISQAEAKQHRWRLRDGREVTIRDMWGKVLVWVKKFQTIGDIAIQADAGYASLPWIFLGVGPPAYYCILALIRIELPTLLNRLQAAANENETREAMLEGMENVSGLITRYLAVEQTYAMQTSELAAGLRQSLLSLYKSILRYLIYQVGLLDRNGLKRLMKRIKFDSLQEVKALLRKVDDNKTRVDSVAAHLSNEQTKNGIDLLQQGQKYLITQQKQTLDSYQDIADGQLDLKLQQESLGKHAEDRLQCLQDILAEWQDDIHGLQDQVSEIYVNTVENANLKRVLDWLSTVRQDLHHAAAQINILESSGRWLLQHPDYQDWRDPTSSSVLWIHGLLGTGKTKLVSIVIESLMKCSNEAFETGRLAYFYCSRNETGTENNASASLRQDPLEILRSLVKQLAKTRGGDSLEAVVTNKYSQLKGRDSEEPRRLTMRECIDVIVAISRDRPITIVVDGLDECKHTAVPELIQSFEEMVRNSLKQVKVFLSTRHISVVVDCLNQYGYPGLEISTHENSGDIARFIDVELDKRIENKSLLHGYVSAELKKEIRETLSERAGSMFWYANLQLNVLCDPTAEQDEVEIRQRLRESPASIKEVYSQIMQDIQHPKNSRKSRSVAQNAMTWLLCVQKPISRGALLKAVSADPVTSDFMIRVCRTLVLEDKDRDTFAFSHLSIREYLEGTMEYESPMQHLMAAERCLETLHTSFLSSAMSQTVTPPEEEFRQYAFLYWPLHFQNINFDATDERKKAIIARLKGLLVRSSGVSPAFKQWTTQIRQLEQSLGKGSPLSMKLRSLQADPDTPLFTACVFGFADLIRQFRHTSHFNLDQCNVHSQTALCVAVENDQSKAVEELLADLPMKYLPPRDVNQVNPLALAQYEHIRPDKSPSVIIYATALQAAAANGLEAMTRALIERGAKVDTVAGYYGTALQAAAQNGHANLVRILLEEHDVEPNSQGGYCGNALQAAARSGNDESVGLLIENGALVSAPGGHHGYPLMAAIESGSVDIVSLLLAADADVQVSTRAGTPLQRAAEMNDKEMVTFLIAQRPELITKDAQPNGKANEKESALAAAAWGGHGQIVSILLENGADVDTAHHDKTFHILHQAASRGMLALVKYCLEVKDCDIDMKTDEGYRYREGQKLMTPLAFASAEGHLKTVRYLLEHGASIEYQDDTIPTLILAATRGQSDVVRTLIEHQRSGSNDQDMDHFLNRVAADGEGSALYQATWSGSLTTVSILMEQGAKYHTPKDQPSPLHVAVTLGRPDLVTAFIRKFGTAEIGSNFSIDAQSNQGTTPLISAIQADNMSVISVLLDNGASLAIHDDLKNSAFHHTIMRKQHAILRLLLSAAERTALPGLLDQRNKNGNTALKEAVGKRDYEAISLLLSHGAVWHNDGHETDLHRAARGNEPLVKDYIGAFRESNQLISLLNSRNMFKRTPLHSAAEFNQPNIVRVLLEAGADLMAIEDKARTALFWAAERNYTECVKPLLDFASRDPAILPKFVDHRNFWRRTALQEAIMRRQLACAQTLLNYGANLMSWEPAQDTPLMLTARDLNKVGWRDCVPMAGSILDKARESQIFDEVINACNVEGETSLWHASDLGQKDMVAFLLSKGADYTISSKNQVTPLHRACWLNRKETTRTILRYMSNDPDQARCRASLNQRDHWGRTALNAAAAQGNSEIAGLLLQNHADYSIACPGGDVPEPWFNALHYAASKDDENVAHIVLHYVSRDSDRAKAQMFLDARLKNDDNITALMAAAINGKASIVAMLLKAGADYTLRNTNRATALILAACSGDLITVKAMLAYVATETDRLKIESTLNAKNNLGKTALVDAAERNFSTIVKALHETPNVDYTLQDNKGFSALHHCASNNSRTSMTTILEFATNNKSNDKGKFEDFLNQPASNGRTSLFIAVANGSFELTRLLLEKYHATYSTYDKEGSSPLHAAVPGNHVPAAEVFLAQASANREKDGGVFDSFLNKRNEKGLTALELAIEGNNGRFMALLKGYGASRS